MRKEIERLVELDREVKLLAHMGAVLGWDQETYMPPMAIGERAEQIAYLEGLAHEKAVSPEIGSLLGALGSSAENPLGDPSLEPLERAYLRVLRRAYDRETKLPGELVTELARAASLGQAAWVEARAASDFARFRPSLERMVSLQRSKAACLGPGRKPYDVLLDLYEPGNDEASVGAVFSALRAELASLLDRIRGRPQVDDSVVKRPCPEGRQAAISEWLMGELAYDRGRGRLDTVAHPFTSTLGSDDVRITTRFLPEAFASGMFSTMHEAGHALYELGIAPGPGYSRTSLSEASSMAIHESQSRLWENLVGRSSAFWSSRYTRLAELAGPALEGVGLEAFLRAINKVEPSLIRVEADEVSYGLHVILRFELESALLSGSLQVAELPGAWNAKMRELLDLAPPDDARGCLQDVHWSAGLFGYFPSYALGNLYASQLWDAMLAELPGIEARIEGADTAELLAWLRSKVHASGAACLPGELVERATGSPLDPGHFTRYLRAKYAALYGL
ncbi:MAG TPA: carboxypeptidase M32 [Spirochaetales bacterium]|nr:carboxypeptidase M32 [Spirochaetales bacterium]HRY53956.1 carboxypeptidase M32 [Spirochaetia bacterium]HRZ64130.1 carboxypeptidase M32 [Spirochaetia bacterium]